jgi:hypothetical protein
MLLSCLEHLASSEDARIRFLAMLVWFLQHKAVLGQVSPLLLHSPMAAEGTEIFRGPFYRSGTAL